jgi:hypothetical protein
MWKVVINNTEAPQLITAGQTVEIGILNAPLPGPRGLTWKGIYDNGTAYVKDDAVSYNGGSYIAKGATTGNLPTDTEYWDVLASRGEDGEGAISTGSRVSCNAAQATSSGRLIRIQDGNGFYFDPEGNEEPSGIAENAAIEDDAISVVLNGQIQITGWGLTPGAVYYAAANGTLTTDPEAAVGRIQQIGVAQSADKMIINIQQPIILE